MKRHFIALASLALLLAACGSGGGGETPVAQDPTQVPAEAAASPQALVNWANTQTASETGEPLGMTTFMPPTSDSDEPATIR